VFVHRRRFPGFERSRINSVANVMAGKMSYAIKDSLGPDYLLGFRNYNGRRHGSRAMMGATVVMMMMVSINVVVMRHADFGLGRRGG
jgi:hypothetical protein